MAGMVRRVNAVRPKKCFALACRAMGEGLRGLKKVDADEIAEAQVRMQVICRTILRSGSWRDRSAVPQQRRRRPRTPGRLCLLSAAVAQTRFRDLAAPLRVHRTQSRLSSGATRRSAGTEEQDRFSWPGIQRPDLKSAISGIQHYFT